MGTNEKRELPTTRTTLFYGRDEARLWWDVAVHKAKYPWRTTLSVGIYPIPETDGGFEIYLTEDGCE